MAEGVRLRHKVVRGATIVIRDMSRRAPVKPGVPWPACGLCRLPSPGHEGYEMRHITLDANGEVTVSEPYWYKLRELVDHGGFEAIEAHHNPPPVRVSMNGHNRRNGLILPVQDTERR